MPEQTPQAVRGMNDILPLATPVWRHVENTLAATALAYGYREVRLPIVEKTALFKRVIGAATDIVEKEMYTFTDRNNESLTLRPEGTAGCVRAMLQSGLINQGAQRLWYGGPMFRHERPQRGRYRQFHQVGAEVFGLAGPDIDAELIVMTARFWRRLNITDTRLHINCLGGGQCRGEYRAALVGYFTQHAGRLDEDSRRRLQTNPLRILDSKNPQTQSIVENAPRIDEYLDADSRRHYQGMRERLDDAGVAYTMDRRLARGLDYYTGPVFEWITDRLGAQGTICGGGRYDDLVAQLGGKPTPAAGFALGLERIVQMMADDVAEANAVADAPDIYLVGVGDEVQSPMLKLAEQLRDEAPGVKISMHCGGGSFKSQLRKADKSGARLAVILGEQEYNEGNVAVKFLRDGDAAGAAPQETLPRERLAARLARIFNRKP